jgi:hypothetical protein
MVLDREIEMLETLIFLKAYIVKFRKSGRKTYLLNVLF